MDEYNLKKQLKRVTIIVIVSSIVLSSFVFSVLAYVIHAAQSAEKMQMKTELEEYKSRIMKQIDKNFQLLTSVSAVLDVTDTVDITEKMEDFLVEVNKANPFISFGYFSMDGSGILNTPNYGTQKLTLNDCNEFAQITIKQALEGENAVSKMFDSKVYNGKLFVYCVPVYNDGKIVGALAASDTLEIFKDIVNGQTVMGGQGYIHILDANGGFLVRSENTLVKENMVSIFDGPYLSDTTKSQASQALSNRESFYGDFKYKGEKCHFYMEPMELNGWYLFCTNRTWTSVLSLGRIVLIIGSAFLFALLLMLVLLYYGYYKFRKNIAALLELAYCDRLTKAKNTLNFDKEFQNVCKNTEHYAIAALNIHNFKGINDLFGKNKGDAVLVYIAATIEKNLKQGEFFCRDTADLFYLYLLDTDEEIIRSRFNRMIDYVSRTSLEYGEYSYELSLYSGVALNGDREEALMALQSIQHSRHMNIAFYNQELHDSVRKKNSIESQMFPALQNREFKLFFQPKFDLRTNKLVGAEALVRWQNPDGTYRYPNEFIPLFEANGFCLKLDMYMIERVCEQIRDWMDAGIEPVPISVNQSKLLFSDRNYPDNLQQILNRYQVPSKWITLEIIEGIATDNLEDLNRQIGLLHEKGFRVSMDDFGSGYSSLNMLHYLKIDELKLDRGFLRKVSHEENERRRIILEQTIIAAKKLGIDTVAEGIETQNDLETMIMLSCDFGQGYFYERPIDAKTFHEKYMNKEV